MREALTIVTDVRSVCLVANALNDPTQRSRLETWLHCAGSFGAAFAKPLWSLVVCLLLSSVPHGRPISCRIVVVVVVVVVVVAAAW